MKYNIKLIKSGTFGLFMGDRLITWSCSAGAIFKALKEVSIKTLLLNIKRAKLMGYTHKVQSLLNIINGGISSNGNYFELAPITDLYWSNHRSTMLKKLILTGERF